MIIRKIFFFVFVCLFIGMVQIKKTRLEKKEIQYKGLNRIPISIISKISELNSNYLSSKTRIKKFLKKLLLNNNFSKIVMEKHNNSLVLNVVERPVLSNIEIVDKINNKKNLEKILKHLKIEKGKILNITKIDLLKKKIKNGFLKIGKFENTINISSFLDKKSNKVNLRINIKPGKFYTLKDFNIIGCKKIPKNEIMSILSMNKQLSFWNFFRDHHFYPKQLKKNFKKLRNYYLSLGFLNFSIKHVKVRILKRSKTIDVFVNINEGKQYFLEKILIEGNILNNSFKKEQEKYVSLNSLLDFSCLEKFKKIILKKYHEYGYEQANASICPVFNKKTKKVEVHISINPKKRYFVHRIYFKGNKYTKDSILRNQIDILEGDIFRKKNFYNSIKKLKETQFFKDVNVRYRILSGNKSNQVDLFYVIKEKNTGLLNFSSGYGMETGVSLNLSMSQKNWLGTGTEYRIDASSNDNEIYGDLSFIYPYYDFYNTVLTNRVFHDRVKGDYAELFRYTDESYGVDSNLTFNINDENDLLCGFSYVHNVLTDLKNHIAIMKYLSSLKSFTKNSYKNVYQKIDDLIINFKWKNHKSISTPDFLKSNFFTSKHKMTLTGKFTLPGSDNSFYKILLDDYESISINRRKNFKLSLRSHLGFGNSFFGKREMPFYENFYAGGSRSVRGFILNSIGPKSVYYNKKNISCIGIHRNNICEYDKYIGGNGMIVTNVDLFFPNKSFKKKKTNYFRPSIFLDSGVVWNSNWKHDLELDSADFFDFSNPNVIYMSSGISYKWISSIGKISISYAVPIGKYDSSKVERLQVNFGSLE